MPGKEYVGVVYYDGDDKYAPSTAEVEFIINKINANLVVDYKSTIGVGEDAIITVTLPGDATGNVTIYINNTNITKEIENGVVKFNISGLTQAQYPFTINYTGNGRYLASEKLNNLLTVDKFSNHKLQILVDDIHVGENATIRVVLPSDATGNVTITVGTETFNTGELVNGEGKIIIENLPKGAYNITAEYIGDGKYDYIKENAHLNVRRWGNYEFNVTITNGTVGGNATVTVYLPSDVTEKVNITIGDESYSVDVINGVANHTVKLESGGNKPVIITYPGDDKYESATIETDLNGQKITNFDFTIKGDNIQYGDTAEVWYYLPADASEDDAKVTINVIGRNVFDMHVNENGTGYAPFPNLPVGIYNVTVTYHGNSKYASLTRYGHLVVNKVSDYDIDVEVNSPEVDENLTFVITLPEDAGGNFSVTVVSVEIGNKTYTADVVNGSASITVPAGVLPNGTYDAIVHYSGDEKYDDITKHVQVDIVKVIDYSFNVTVHDIYVGDEETIAIELPEDVTTTIKLIVGNETYEVNVVNGSGSKQITGLKHGLYQVEAIFEGDAKYATDSQKTSFIVSRVSDYKFEMNYTEAIKAGENATIKVTLPVDAKGNVSVLINNKTFTGEIKQGRAIINVTDLSDGVYSFTLNFVDDGGKYSSDSKVGLITVTKTDIEIVPVYENITVGDVAVINVTMPAGATGNLTLLIDGRSFSEKISSDGKVSFRVSDLDADNHTFIISYDGDMKYNGDVYTGILKATKVSDYSWDFNVSDIKVGQDEIINITLPDDATGDLIITVGNVSYHKAANGNTTYTVTISRNGTYKVVIEYQGNGKYANKTLTKSFNATKNDVEISIEFADNQITVSLAGDATGKVNITMGTKSELVDIVGGKAVLNIGDIVPGDYTIYANYSGDNKYNANSTSKSVNIPKVEDYEIIINTEDVTYGNDVTITVVLPADATGKVNITVDGNTTEVPIADGGKATLKVDTPAIGQHNITVNYKGNVKYADNSEKDSFNVKGVEITPEIKVENDTVVVKVPSDATGNITIKIGDETVSVPIDNGTATWSGSNLEPGDYEVSASYSGDDKYDSFDETATVNIAKIKDYEIKVVAKDIAIGDKTDIVVTLPDDATGVVLIDLNGTGYYADIVSGKAVLQVNAYVAGTSNVIVSYQGNNKYEGASNSTKFNVTNKLNPEIEVIESNLVEGEDALITIKLPDNATGNVTVSVDGFKETKEVTGGELTFDVGKHDAGSYNIDVSYSGDSQYMSKDITKIMTITKLNDPHVSLTGVDVVNYYNHTVFVVRLLDINNMPIVGENIVFKVNNVSYTNVTDVLGNAYLYITLPVGQFNIESSFAGNDIFKSNVTNNTITIKSSIVASDLTRGWNSPYDYQALFLTESGNPLVNGDVQFIVNGKTYSVKTDSKGIAKLESSKLAVGTYTVTMINGATGEKISHKATIVARLIENKDLTMDYLSGKSFSVLVIGDDGKPVGAGEIVSMTINTRTYAVKTNAQGYAVRSIGLIPGSYTMVSTYKDFTVKNNVKVKQTLKSSSVTVKKSAKTFKLKATLKWSNGKVIKNKKVTFRFNGKTYSAKTNSKGIAQVTIKKSVIKKLKAGKKYTVTAKYKDESAKSTVKVKK